MRGLVIKPVSVAAAVLTYSTHPICMVCSTLSSQELQHEGLFKCDAPKLCQPRLTRALRLEVYVFGIILTALNIGRERFKAH